MKQQGPALPTFTPEQIAKMFSSCGDSVKLINDINAQSSITDIDVNNVKRNIQHLEIMKTKKFWTNEDFTAIDAAIALVVVAKP